LFAAVGVVIIYKHRANIERIANGTEVRISYLWNREKETKRVKENMDEEEAV